MSKSPIERAAEAAFEADPDEFLPDEFGDLPGWQGDLYRAIGRAVFESIDRDALIDVLVMSPLSDFTGTDMRPIERTADAILAHLRGAGS